MRINSITSYIKRYILPAVLIVLTIAMPVQVLAKEYAANTVVIKVAEQITIKSSVIEDIDHTFQFALIPLQDGNPMPAGTENGMYAITLGSNQSTSCELTFQSAGEYRYQIYQTTGARENFTYDTTVYTLYIYVTNTETGLTALMAIADESGSKYEAVIFSDTYDDGTEQQTESETETSVMKPTDDEKKTSTGMPAKTGDQTKLIFWIIAVVLFAVLLMILFSIIHIRTPYDQLVDDQQQELYLRNYKKRMNINLKDDDTDHS